jgi:hypothetical protein
MGLLAWQASCWPYGWSAGTPCWYGMAGLGIAVITVIAVLAWLLSAWAFWKTEWLALLVVRVVLVALLVVRVVLVDLVKYLALLAWLWLADQLAG